MRRNLIIGALALGVLLALGLWSGSGPAQAAMPETPQAGVITALQEGFEKGGLYQTEFVSDLPECTPGGCGWETVGTDHHQGLQAAFAPDVAGVSDQQMLPQSALALPTGILSATLTFWQSYSFEYNGTEHYDGGVLEGSTDGGNTWFDLGSSITTGGYNGAIVGGSGNPLTGRAAWVGLGRGSANDFFLTSVNLASYAGHTLTFRFRLGSDENNPSPGAVGWWIDDVAVAYKPGGVCSISGWTPRAPIQTATGEMAMAGQGGRIYSFGGASTPTLARVYDPSTNVWTALSPLPAPRMQASAVSDGTYIYILGGTPDGNAGTNTLWRYNPAANTYTTLAAAPAATFDQSLAYLNGKLYQVGGCTAAPCSATASVRVYTIATNNWASAAAYPTASSGVAVVALGSYLYGGGGSALGADPKTYRYDPTTNTWNDGVVADLPGGRAHPASGVYNGHWMIAGGGTESQLTNSVLAWDPGTNAWRSLPALPHAVYNAGAAGVTGGFYVVGGDDATGSRSETEQYSEGTCNVPPPTPCPISFSDVPASSPFYVYVRCLACRGIVAGYGDGSFHVGAAVTRGQIAKFVSNAAGYTDPIAPGQQTFADVLGSNPFWLYVERAALHSVVSGYACGGPGEPCDGQNRPYFRPNANVTRGQTAKFVSNAAGYSDFVTPGQQTFVDVPHTNAQWTFVERAAQHGVVNGYVCGGAGEPCPGLYFRLTANVTRGQTAKFIGNAFFPDCSTP